MAYTQNSISSLVAQFLRLQKNSLEIINGLNEVATSTNENVEIQLLDEFGFPTTSNIPAYGYLRSQIQRLDSNIQALSGLGENFSSIRNPDGTFTPIYKAEPLRDPEPLRNLQVPSTFATKDNWFFESFLSPLLYVSIDVTGQIPDSSDRISIKRIIANTITDEQKTYFDQNLSGKNDISESQFINGLTQGGITYFTDEEIIPLPLRQIRYVGYFSVLQIFDSVVSTTDANNQTVQETRRNYRLNTVNYTDTTSGISDGKTLAVNDYLLTEGGSTYQVVSVDINQTTVQLKRVIGYEPIKIGPNTLSFSSSNLGSRFVQVNVGYNERLGVFFKKIDDIYNVISSTWSPGITFFTNNLRINTTSGIQTLESFYVNSVSDIGQIFLNAAKEKKIPAYQGLFPNTPLLAENNFKVVQINAQLTNGTSPQLLNQKIAEKTALQAEISQLDAAILSAQSKLNSVSIEFTPPSSQSSTDSATFSSTPLTLPSNLSVGTVQADIGVLTSQRVQKQQLLTSIIQEISTIRESNPAIYESPKYRVRGFWAIPSPVSDPSTGPQQVIQFKVQYRYLSDSGAANPIQQVDFIDNNGQTKTGAFSNWNEFKTEIRSKVYDPQTGVYVWAPEITADADANNINQLDIPITKGEQVEIRIQSISEAGWPENPMTSPFSESVIVSFPEDLSVQSQAANTMSNIADLATVQIQSDLSSRGLDELLAKRVVTEGRTFFLDASSVSSGFYGNSGQPIDLLQKIQELQDQISSLQSVIQRTVGTLEVYIIFSNGQSTKVSPGSTIELPSLIYNQIFTNPTTSDSGKIASSIYNIQILNPSAGTLELASSLPGGLDTLAGAGSYSLPEGYTQNLRYGEIGISITSLVPSNIFPAGAQSATLTSFQQLKQAPPYSSANENGQYIYPRWKSVGLDREYYLPAVAPTQSYNYDGTLDSNGNIVPVNNSAVVPFTPTASLPTYPNGGINGSVWNGATASSGGVIVGAGNGYISEFSISKDHPAISANLPFLDLVKPNIKDGVVVYPNFRHSNYFFTDISSTNYYQQLGWSPVLSTFATGPASSRGDNMYPNKLGFEANDVYLIGKYTCGSYLFLGPPTSSTIQVEGSTSLANKLVFSGVQNAINIPVIFQFRATDYLGNIGGYRINGQPSNITYSKSIGIDIQVRNSSTFSFDLVASGSFKQETLRGLAS
jgi:hypothetical protein